MVRQGNLMHISLFSCHTNKNGILEQVVTFSFASVHTLEFKNNRIKHGFFIYLSSSTLAVMFFKFAPITLATCFPSLKKRKVGMDSISYFAARSSWSSTSTFTKIASCVFSERASISGAIRLQGPHHCA